MNEKQIFLETEGDAFFKRNMECDKSKLNAVNQIYELFIRNNMLREKDSIRILEVGCCSGYNLMYLYERLSKEEVDIQCYGIDPSEKAIEYGNDQIRAKSMEKNIYLSQGMSDLLDFEDDSFDIVILGFFLYCVDRRNLMKTVAETDRVLKATGIICLHDFDSNVPFRRTNIHNQNVLTYKMNYCKLFLSNPQYILAEKHSYTSEHTEIIFERNIQNRQQVCILYKDTINNAYIYVD